MQIVGVACGWQRVEHGSAQVQPNPRQWLAQILLISVKVLQFLLKPYLSFLSLSLGGIGGTMGIRLHLHAAYSWEEAAYWYKRL